ncbi:hypothetical protein CYMTET_33171 [Cymbomonas tetramitiformis]|uniref:Thioredoxin domain-containing protein n=1 Tax=Cymbomonas tetramitiformis TaxID=36881 RepID=A0AAE0FDJ7_9CHLO|nr:hypothetical protein CYMTET_33171 [Cymbomonas tetramitiformis]
MKFVYLFCTLVYALHTQVLSAPPPSKEATYVASLTPDNFNDFVGRDQGVLVEFFAPWCIHCKRLAPVLELVGHAFEREKRVRIAKVDAIAHPALKQLYDVSGFPTLKWFPAGSFVSENFEGSRDAVGIVDYVNSKADKRRPHV